MVRAGRVGCRLGPQCPVSNIAEDQPGTVGLECGDGGLVAIMCNELQYHRCARHILIASTNLGKMILI